MRVTSTAPGVYLVHEEGQPPVEGVAVYYFELSGLWACELHGFIKGTTRPDCTHIALAKQAKIIALAKEEEII